MLRHSQRRSNCRSGTSARRLTATAPRCRPCAEVTKTCRRAGSPQPVGDESAGFRDGTRKSAMLRERISPRLQPARSGLERHRGTRCAVPLSPGLQGTNAQPEACRTNRRVSTARARLATRTASSTTRPSGRGSSSRARSGAGRPCADRAPQCGTRRRRLRRPRYLHLEVPMSIRA